MDEASRKLERSSQASGDRFARARAANEHLRSGRFDVALAVLGAPAADGSTGLEVTTRALAHARLGQGAQAFCVLEAAVGSEGSLEVEPAALLEVLAHALDGAEVPLGRPRAARVLARVPSRPELAPVLDSLRHDADALVRLALVTERPTFTKDERVSRVYGSHGADYETGQFIAFDAPLEVRLRTFELALFTSIRAALLTLQPMASLLELRPAFGDGWGLGGQGIVVGPPDLKVTIEGLNALDLLPWKLRDCGVRPYDLMEDEDRFVRRLARDVGGHPIGRQAPYDPSAPLLARFLAKHPMRGGPCRWEEIRPLLDEAGTAFSPLGFRACEHFAKAVRGET